MASMIGRKTNRICLLLEASNQSARTTSSQDICTWVNFIEPVAYIDNRYKIY